MHIIFIDNFDSFSYNLTDNLKSLGHKVTIFRNDLDPLFLKDFIAKIEHNGERSLIFLSPGPSHPKDAHNLLKIIDTFLEKIPFMGVCLGHQALALSLGSCVTRCPQIVHGQISPILHNGKYCFEGLPNPLIVGRYHSLYVKDCPKDCEEIAKTLNLNMALYSKKYRFISLQFHPESILTAFGPKILEQGLNYLDKTCA